MNGPYEHNIVIMDRLFSTEFFRIPKAIQKMTELSPAAKDALMAITNRCRQGGRGKMCPSLQTIAEDIGISRSSARRAVQELLTVNKDGRKIRIEEPTKKWIKNRYKGKKIDKGIERLSTMSAVEKKDIGILKRKIDMGRECYYELSVPDWIWAKYEEKDEERGTNSGTPGGTTSGTPTGTNNGTLRRLREGHQSKEKVALPAVGQTPRPDPSSLLDSASKASDLSDKAKAKHQSRERKWDKDMEVEKANWKASINSWKGEKFYAYMLHLCQRYGVKVNDPVELTQGIPARFARAMNDTLKMLSVRQVSNEHWGRILERLIKEWNQGGSDIMGKKGGISVYGFRYKIDEVLDTFRDRQPVKTKPGAKTTPTVSVKEFLGVVQKKED